MCRTIECILHFEDVCYSYIFKSVYLLAPPEAIIRDNSLNLKGLLGMCLNN
jgi:hypothetical protein